MATDVGSGITWWAIASAFGGTIIGGGISYWLARMNLKAAKKQRDEEIKRIQQAQAHALLFKMIRIHSDFYGIDQHFDSCLNRAAKAGFKGDPWQFFLPLANPPEPIHFTAEEMGMLLGLRNDDVFNFVGPMDVVHNSVCDALRVLNSERRALAERLKPEKVEGLVFSGNLDKDQWLSLRPRMVEVNTLFEGVRTEAKKNAEESGKALDQLNKLFREKLGLAYKIESKAEQKTS